MSISKIYNSCAESLSRDIEMNKRKLNRQIAFDNFKRKHYLDNYYFFLKPPGYGGYHNGVLYASNDIKTIEILRQHFDEISSPHTLVKYVKMVQCGKMKIGIDYYGNETYTLEELKENILIERLAGLL